VYTTFEILYFRTKVQLLLGNSTRLHVHVQYVYTYSTAPYGNVSCRRTAHYFRYSRLIDTLIGYNTRSVNCCTHWKRSRDWHFKRPMFHVRGEGDRLPYDVAHLQSLASSLGRKSKDFAPSGQYTKDPECRGKENYNL